MMAKRVAELTKGEVTLPDEDTKAMAAWLAAGASR